jgi:hypothetical protein
MEPSTNTYDMMARPTGVGNPHLWSWADVLSCFRLGAAEQEIRFRPISTAAGLAKTAKRLMYLDLLIMFESRALGDVSMATRTTRAARSLIEDAFGGVEREVMDLEMRHSSSCKRKFTGNPPDAPGIAYPTCG